MPLQVHHRHIVARVGEKDMQQVLRPQAEAGVVLAGTRTVFSDTHFNYDEGQKLVWSDFEK